MATIKNLDDLKTLNKMEALQTMSEGMDAKKNKKPHLCGNLIQCVAGIVMLSIGSVYYTDCEFDATTYLVVGGTIMLISNLLSIVAIMTTCECDDKLAKALTPVIGLVQFCIFLWGTIVVFGYYSTWSYDKDAASNLLEGEGREDGGADATYYCNYTPFIFTYVLHCIVLIILCVLLMITVKLMITACLTACCACCVKGAGGDGGAVEPVKSETSLEPEKQMEV